MLKYNISPIKVMNNAVHKVGEGLRQRNDVNGLKLTKIQGGYKAHKKILFQINSSFSNKTTATKNNYRQHCFSQNMHWLNN